MDIGWKVVSAGAGLLSGVVAKKAVDVAWKSLGRGKRPAAADYTEPMSEAVVFAVVSAAVGALVNEVIMRKAAKWYGLDQVSKGVAENIEDAVDAE